MIETYYVLKNQYGNYVNFKVQEYSLTVANTIKYGCADYDSALLRANQLKDSYNIEVEQVNIKLTLL